MLTAAIMLILTNGKNKKNKTFPVYFCYFTVTRLEDSSVFKVFLFCFWLSEPLGLTGSATKRPKSPKRNRLIGHDRQPTAEN